jgi:hypothetical protein
VILLAGAAAATDGSDHLSTGENRHRSNAWQSLAAQNRRDIAPESGDDSLRLTISLVGRLNAAAATALAREVSGVKNPVPSPRADKTKRPASSTTVAVIGVPSSRAFACAALTAFSAISSVSEAMLISTPFQVRDRASTSRRTNIGNPSG